MCGICGAVSFDGQPVSRDGLALACEALRHRGPDHSGVWFDDDSRVAVGLGATRLAVLDPQAAGNQPMHSADGRYHLSFNGEIYNYHAVRRELTALGRTFVTNTDTEVVLYACAQWGVEALSKFNGMWALAFFDSGEKCGFLSRDRFGIKPVFYSQTPSALRFASELPSLRQLGDFDRGVDQHALTEHLTFGYITHPRTIFSGAKRLSPGHVLRFDPSGAYEPQPYFDLPAESGAEGSCDYSEARCFVRRALADAVVRRRTSDVPIGAFLSGGLDSSIVVAHLAEATGQPVTTFAVGYESHASYDERGFARTVANRFSTDHHEVVIAEREATAMIPRVLDHLGEPVGDSSIIPIALLSKFARDHVTVALSGDGGDELFGGYWRYLGHDALARFYNIPRVVRTLALKPAMRFLGATRSGAIANRVRQFQKLLRAGGGDAMANHLAWSRILAPETAGLFENPCVVDGLVSSVVAQAEQMTGSLPASDPLNRVLSFDLRHQLPADMLQKVDLASMMFSLEVRVPFLDPGLVDYVHRLPSSFKIDRGRRKRILVDAYRGLLPDCVLDRSKKGFEVPIGEFLRSGPVAEMFQDIVTADSLASVGSLRFAGVNRLYNAHKTHRADHADLLFALLSLCWWVRKA